MTEMNEAMNAVETATSETLDSINFEEGGFEALAGAAVGAGVAGTAGFKLGYAAGVRDAAGVSNKTPKALLDEIRTAKGKKPKRGGFLGTGWTIQSPFKKVEVEKPEDTTSKGTEGKKDSETDNKKKK